MVQNEYVETSDAEELEQLELIREAEKNPPALTAASTPSQTSPLSRDKLRLDMPRKRRKILHSSDDRRSASPEAAPSSARSVLLDLELESAVPRSDTQDPPASTALSRDEYFELSVPLGSRKLDMEGEEDRIRNDFDNPFSQRLASDTMDITHDLNQNGSQDELDVISRTLSQTELGPIGQGELSLSQTSGQQPVSPSVFRQEVYGELDNADGNIALDQPQDPFLLFSSQQGDHMSPLASPNPSPDNRARVSSLPPSSPPRTSTSVLNTPQRASSLSPTHMSLSQPRSQTRDKNSGTEEIPFEHQNALFQLEYEGDEDDLNRGRYSLRTRKARQLNPYEYDKRLYKQQMRHNPDAIVKIVSPRRHAAEHVHRSHEPPEEDEFIAPDDEDESQEMRRKRRRERRSSDPPGQDAEIGDDTPLWLPPGFDMSDDELPPLPPAVPNKSTVPAKSGDLNEAEKSRRRRFKKFPLLQARDRKDAHTERNDPGKTHETHDIAVSAITYSKRKDVRHNLHRRASLPDDIDSNQRKAEARNLSPNSPLRAFEGGSGWTNPDNEFSFQDRSTDNPERNPKLHDPEPEDDYTHDNDDFGNDTYEPSGHRKTSHIMSSSSDQQLSSESEDEREAEKARINRKRLKQLGRMFPAIMIPKLVGSAPVPRATQARPKSIVMATSDSDGSGNEANGLVPGRSRITKRSNGASANAEIKGDSESSDSEHMEEHAATGPESVIDVDSSDSDIFSARSSDDDSGPNLLEKTIADAGYFEENFSGQPARWKEEALFDKMLSRGRANSSRSKSRRGKVGVSSRSIHHGLKSNGLDLSIAKSQPHPRPYRRHGDGSKQSRISFKRIPSKGVNHHLAGDAETLSDIDLAYGIGEDNSENVPPDDLNPHRKLSKKQRREVAQRSTLHTISSHGKSIRSGRRKGVMTVQIDLADQGLRQALKPLHSDSPLQSSRAFNRSTSGQAIKGGKHIPPVQRHSSGQKLAFKQTSLHDFASHDDHVADDLEFRAPERRSKDVPVVSARQSGAVLQEQVANLSSDMGIHVPTPGLAFGEAFYLGKQLLPSLLDFTFKNGAMTRPDLYTGFGLISLDAEMMPSCFVESVEVTSNILSEWLDDEDVQSTDIDNVRRYEHLMQTICQYAPWMYMNASADERANIQRTVSFCAGRTTDALKSKVDKPITGPQNIDCRTLAVEWFTVELTTRMLAAARWINCELDSSSWRDSVSLLVRSLIKLGMRKTLRPIKKRDLTSPSIHLRAAELWICLMHLLPQAKSLSNTALGGFDAFWPTIRQLIKEDTIQSKDDIEASEHLWELIFCLSSLSHFSAHGISTSAPRLPPFWDIVCDALDVIRLTHDKEKDACIRSDQQRGRDTYVRLVVARCFVLGTKWKWPLHDALPMFKKLVEIFRSRHFGNLRGENPNFPLFLRNCNVDLLEEIRISDTAFGLYLKLIVQAAKTDQDVSNVDKRSKRKIPTLLQLAVPLSGVAFSKVLAPTTDELTQLINRLSAVAVAILIEGKDAAKLEGRLRQARRYISFADADDRSRQACISAATYMSICVNHLHVELDRPLNWLGDMCDTILQELQEVETGLRLRTGNTNEDANARRQGLIIGLNMVLVSVRRIIETPTMGTTEAQPRYPSVSLLNGPWVKRVFPFKRITNVVSTRIAVLQLVQAFLKIRADVLLFRPTPNDPETQEESYPFDEDLISIFVNDDENKKRDKEVAEIMNSDIVPNVFRFIMQYFGDNSLSSTDESREEQYWGDADEWINCWVDCTGVVVRNGIRPWSWYLNIGASSWMGISDTFIRRRIAVRFMYRLLKCDPSAYSEEYRRHFISVFLQSLVIRRLTMENEYLSLLLTLDGLHHPLLQGIPVKKLPGKEDFHLTPREYFDTRASILSRIITNLDSFLGSVTSYSERNKHEFESQEFITCLLEMLEAVTDIWKNLSPSEEREKYEKLCRHVFLSIKSNARVASIPRLTKFIEWGETLDEPKET